MPKNIDLKGTSGKKYDLDALSKTETRSSSGEALVVQIWYWNPNFSNAHKHPNPPSPKIGSIWLSKKITAESDPDLYAQIAAEE